MSILNKVFSKIRSSLYVFKKAEIMQNIVNKEINGEYDNLCHKCYFNERYHQHAKLQGILQTDNKLSISIYLGGALGDYIVYLRFVDEISSICECNVDLFTDRIEFANYVYGQRKNVTIIHDAHNCLFNTSFKEYDLAVHLDHGLTLKHCNLGDIREKSPDFYVTACKIVEYSQSNKINIEKQHERESVILRRAKFLGENKWSKLSCNGAIDMSEKYSNIVINPDDLSVLDRYNIKDVSYITVNYGADKNMGGTAQTKVLPLETIEKLINKFKQTYPEILVVQTGVKNSLQITGADRYAFDCKLGETAVILKNSICHVDSEGGLVHMSAQMSTPCVVSFGPTPVYYYGYERNINIVSPACSDCMATTPQWSKVCSRGMQVPVCMKAITPDMLLDGIKSIIEKLHVSKNWDNIKQYNELDINKLSNECEHNVISNSKKICIISNLDTNIISKIKELKKTGKKVEVFIPLDLDDNIVSLRTELKKMDVIVEYGTSLNIARISSNFDTIICKNDDIIENNKLYAKKELLRIIEENGVIVWLKQ